MVSFLGHPVYVESRRKLFT